MSDEKICLPGGDRKSWDGDWIYAEADESDLTPRERAEAKVERIRQRLENGEDVQSEYAAALAEVAA